MAPVSSPSFGLLLKRSRRAARLTQAQLAERAGFSVVYISMLERGARSPQRTTVALLAEALALSPSERAAFQATTPLPPPHATYKPQDATAPALPIGSFLGATPTVALVGRESELDVVAAHLAEVVTGQGRLLMLVGEPGVGKTRLAQEISVQARARGFRVVTGRCYEPQQTFAFAPFVEALAKAAAGADTAMQAQLPERWPEVIRLLPNQEASAQTPRQLDDRDARQRLFWQVTGFLGMLAEQAPLALLLDDLHWADSASLDLLQHLAQHTRDQRLLLVGTYRDVEVGRQRPLAGALSELDRDELALRITVRRLVAEETTALIGVTLGANEAAAVRASAVSPQLAQLIYQRSEGNAFFTRQVVRALQEQGVLQLMEGQWMLNTAGSALDIPESVRAVVGQRLAHLAPLTRDVLHEASVLGQVFAFSELQRLGRRGEQEVEEALEEAAGAGIVRERAHDQYHFNHALTHDTLYAELSARKKRRLHRAAADTIERLPDHERRASELAYHLLAADEGERALPYALLAGDQAAAVYAHAEAAGHYRTAVELARDVGDQLHEAEATEKQSGALWQGGRLDEARDLIDHAAHLYQSLGDVEGELRALARIAARYVGTGQVEACEARVLPRLSALERNATDTHAGRLAEVYSELGMGYVFAFRGQEALAAIARGEQFAHATQDDTLRVRALLTRAFGTATLGIADAGALDAALEIIAFAERVGDMNALRPGLTLAYNCYLGAGDFVRARAYLERIQQVDQLTQQPAKSLSVIGELAFCCGEWRRAREAFDELIALEERQSPFGAGLVSGYGSLSLGLLELAEGDEEVAISRLEPASERAYAAGDLQASTLITAAFAEADLLAGRVEAAQRRLARVFTHPGLQELCWWSVPLIALLAWADLALGHMNQAWAAMERCRAYTRAPWLRLLLPDVLRVCALIAMAREQWTAAEEALEEAVQVAREMPYPWAELKALYFYGQLHAAMGERVKARASYKQALAICKRLGEGLYRPHIEQAYAAAPM
jgi:transcriptional regulator with XRE-family HTH domain/tetratricopeptide (TPR) repeat protein